MDSSRVKDNRIWKKNNAGQIFEEYISNDFDVSREVSNQNSQGLKIFGEIIGKISNKSSKLRYFSFSEDDMKKITKTIEEHRNDKSWWFSQQISREEFQTMSKIYPSIANFDDSDLISKENIHVFVQNQNIQRVFSSITGGILFTRDFLRFIEDKSDNFLDLNWEVNTYIYFLTPAQIWENSFDFIKEQKEQKKVVNFPRLYSDAVKDPKWSKKALTLSKSIEAARFMILNSMKSIDKMNQIDEEMAQQIFEDTNKIRQITRDTKASHIIFNGTESYWYFKAYEKSTFKKSNDAIPILLPDFGNSTLDKDFQMFDTYQNVLTSFRADWYEKCLEKFGITETEFIPQKKVYIFSVYNPLSPISNAKNMMFIRHLLKLYPEEEDRADFTLLFINTKNEMMSLGSWFQEQVFYFSGMNSGEYFLKSIDVNVGLNSTLKLEAVFFESKKTFRAINQQDLPFPHFEPYMWNLSYYWPTRDLDTTYKTVISQVFTYKILALEEEYTNNEYIVTLQCENIEKYKKERILGEGGSGVAYLICKPKSSKSDEQCDKVVKVEYTSDNREIVEKNLKMLRESQISNKAHDLDETIAPKIFSIKVCEKSINVEETTFLTLMEYIKGDSLVKYLNNLSRKKQIEASELDVFKKVVERLSFLHRHNIGHGDTNPSNIIIRNYSVTFIDYTEQTWDKTVDLVQLIYYFLRFTEIKLDVMKMIVEPVIEAVRKVKARAMLNTVVLLIWDSNYSLNKKLSYIEALVFTTLYTDFNVSPYFNAPLSRVIIDLENHLSSDDYAKSWLKWYPLFKNL